VIETIRELGLDLHVVLNKGAVMVLPHGVDKATGLKAALDRLGLSAHNVVGAGDAENDHSFLAACGCSVAVANALPDLKAEVDLVTAGARSLGLAELADRMVADDLASVDVRTRRGAD
jgi:hydroxymethylpyrimidine pyrophosphatase-like HAD family hydrolase